MSFPFSMPALILGNNREFAGIIPDVTISEEHIDEVVVTKHPVDVGAQINDHAYKTPGKITCRFGWSDSSILVNSALQFSSFRGIKTTQEIYKKLLQLQKNRQPFPLKTGKRMYDNVIITKLSLRTDAETEHSLIIDVTFEEILIAQTKTVKLRRNNPSRTSSVNNGGKRYALGF